ncbi:hypothetical protein AKJ57_02015 [candidate division MSBL1 archaeon SCGC-AAA259A05]|uniref:acetate--CoA ligase (ADP-forming) n=1 Tax=candidate division MSBL1 archaeon SCGC-AAA259A05 TaxID=1698259 RepID=A0A133UAN3_9EURY|nr:hypothetical protein AKJ57_02015 [candidate division MSBL1 archaeon SCGC-AAA259A05]
MSGRRNISGILKAVQEDGRKILTEYESKNILSEIGISVIETILATSKLEAVDAARELKYPVVMKVSSPDIMDRSEADAIRVGLTSEIEVRQAFEDITINARSYDKEADVRGVVVQKYVPSALEVIVKISQDRSFGPTVVFGVAGVWTDFLEDMSYRLAPVSKSDAGEMIEEIDGYPMLLGGEEGNPVDISALKDIIHRISQLPMEYEGILEINLDPVFALGEGKGATVVDARIELK